MGWLQSSMQRFPADVPSAGLCLRNEAITRWFTLEGLGGQVPKSFKARLTPGQILDHSASDMDPAAGFFSSSCDDSEPVPEGSFRITIVGEHGQVLERDLVPLDLASMWGSDHVYKYMRRVVHELNPGFLIFRAIIAAGAASQIGELPPHTAIHRAARVTDCEL